MYYVQNDQEKAYPLLDEMYRLTEEEEEQQTIKQETLERMDTLAVALRMQMMDQAEPEELADLSDLLVETCTDILSADAGTITREKSGICNYLYVLFYAAGKRYEKKRGAEVLFAGRFKKLSRRVRYWILQRCRLR